MIATIIQAAGLLTASIGIGLIYQPAGITVLGVSVFLFGLALERGR